MYFLPPRSNILLLCAHPDDEIGCGALVSKLVEGGHVVHYAYFSDCAESTESLGYPPEQLLHECRQSCSRLGINLENCHSFDFPVRRFPQFRQDILEALVILRDMIRPSLVLTASRGDIHQDHSTLTDEAVRAYKYCNIIGYEFPWNHIHSHLNLFVRVEKHHIDAKLSAWNCYKTQSTRVYHGDNVLISLARVRGVQANSEFAEGYDAIRVFL